MATVTERQSLNYSPHVVALANAQGVAEHLEPIAEMTQDLFPELRRLVIEVQTDMDVADMKWIAYEVFLPRNAEPSQKAAWSRWVNELADRQHEWSGRLLQVCTPSQALHFTIQLDFID